MITDGTWFIACDCAVDGVPLPGGGVPATWPMPRRARIGDLVTFVDRTANRHALRRIVI
jgi:hypothetical protein